MSAQREIPIPPGTPAPGEHPRRLAYTTTPDDEGMSVEAILRKRMRLSSRTVSRAKFVGDGITLDGARVRVKTTVSPGQTVSILIGDSAATLAASQVTPEEGPLSIAYEDDDLIIVDKPAGIAVHPGPGHRTGTLGNRVVSHMQGRGLPPVLHAVHRLDIGTSGLVVFATNATAQQRLTADMHTSRFSRTYLALCGGAPSEAEEVVDAPIAQPDQKAQLRVVRADGKPARTRYEVLATFAPRGCGDASYAPLGRDEWSCATLGCGDAPARVRGAESSGAGANHDDSRPAISLLRLTLETGRTHQIRVHMAHIGCPLVGDALYGGDESLMSRPALHSSHIELEHPITSRRLVLDSPLPNDMRSLIAPGVCQKVEKPGGHPAS